MQYLLFIDYKNNNNKNTRDEYNAAYWERLEYQIY